MLLGPIISMFLHVQTRGKNKPKQQSMRALVGSLWLTSRPQLCRMLHLPDRSQDHQTLLPNPNPLLHWPSLSWTLRQKCQQQRHRLVTTVLALTTLDDVTQYRTSSISVTLAKEAKASWGVHITKWYHPKIFLKYKWSSLLEWKRLNVLNIVTFLVIELMAALKKFDSAWSLRVCLNHSSGGILPEWSV